MRTYAALPYEYSEGMAELTDEEFGRLMRALLRYSKNGEAIVPTGNERFYAKLVMVQEDRFQRSYDELAQKRSEAGKKGAAARWGSKAILPYAPDGNYNTNQYNTIYPTTNQTLPSRAEIDAALIRDMDRLEEWAKERRREQA